MGSEPPTLVMMPTMMPGSFRRHHKTAPWRVLWLALVFSTSVEPGVAQESPPAQPAQIEIAAVHVSPENPGADTLCTLSVEIRNAGDRSASELGFDVTLNGDALEVYAKELWYQEVPAGETTTVRLFNFWTSESDRPAPSDGKLDLVVTLRQARWFEITRQGEGRDEVETWKPVAVVDGLPVSAARVLTLE